MFSKLYDLIFPLVEVTVIGKWKLLIDAYYVLELPDKTRIEVKMKPMWANVGDILMMRRGFFGYF